MSGVLFWLALSLFTASWFMPQELATFVLSASIFLVLAARYLQEEKKR